MVNYTTRSVQNFEIHSCGLAHVENVFNRLRDLTQAPKQTNAVKARMVRMKDMQQYSRNNEKFWFLTWRPTIPKNDVERLRQASSSTPPTASLGSRRSTQSRRINSNRLPRQSISSATLNIPGSFPEVPECHSSIRNGQVAQKQHLYFDRQARNYRLEKAQMHHEVEIVAGADRGRQESPKRITIPTAEQFKNLERQNKQLFEKMQHLEVAHGNQRNQNLYLKENE